MFKIKDQKKGIQNVLLPGAMALCILAVVGGVFMLTKEIDESSLTAGVSTILQSPQLQQENQIGESRLKQVLVSPSSTIPGGNVTITVDASNAVSEIGLIDVFTESPSGVNSARAGIINIDGEGKRFGDVTIPSDGEQGIWIVKTISIMDMSGAITDFHYGKDIFTTFSVTTL